MNAKLMLDIGKEHNYKTVKDCYEHIFMHEQSFFLSDDKDAEIDTFENEIDKYGLTLHDTIEQAYDKINGYDCNNCDIDNPSCNKCVGA
jgi:hypothetical protein